jgi:2-phosphosulfolactate phosphatase
MHFNRATLENCSEAIGTVVVIDVLRAFSTAAYAFAAGAEQITLVGTVEEAFALRASAPSSLLIGEVEGLPIPGFDFGNSPSALAGLDLTGREMVQRTSAGTQGIVRSSRAHSLLATGFCCARATARWVRNQSRDVTFVITGAFSDDHGDEDAACAGYIQDLVSNPTADPAPYLARVRRSAAAAKFNDPAEPDFPLTDLECCLAVDIFDFAMLVHREPGQLVLRKVASG